jgi:hypothetical protein
MNRVIFDCFTNAYGSKFCVSGILLMLLPCDSQCWIVRPPLHSNFGGDVKKIFCASRRKYVPPNTHYRFPPLLFHIRLPHNLIAGKVWWDGFKMEKHWYYIWGILHIGCRFFKGYASFNSESTFYRLLYCLQY